MATGGPRLGDRRAPPAPDRRLILIPHLRSALRSLGELWLIVIRHLRSALHLLGELWLIVIPRLRSAGDWLGERYHRTPLPSAVNRSVAAVMPRLRSAGHWLGERYRRTLRPSRARLGVAAASVAALAGIIAGVTATAAPSASAAAPARAASRAAGGHAAAHGTDAASAATLWSWRAALKARPAPPAQPQPASRPAAPAPVAAEHPAPAHPAAPAAPARPAAPAAPARPAAPAPPPQPYLIYDSVEPNAIPPGQDVATYATGPYAASPSELGGAAHVMWIDVYGTDYAASALDVEPTDATPTQAADWAYNRLRLYPGALAHIYTNISEWPEVQQACSWLPASMQARIRWWIADPTGVPHLVPGSQATQWYWGQNYDISTAAPDF
jgi:hypothetical protein